MKRPVIVTTVHRGVFFGYSEDTTGEQITLSQARMCLYWSADMQGILGLASKGPSATCKIGPAADVTLRDITAVFEVSKQAVKAWELAPWARQFTVTATATAMVTATATAKATVTATAMVAAATATVLTVLIS